MKIRALKTIANPTFAANIGLVVNVPTKLAKELIKIGAAEEVQDKSAVAERAVARGPVVAETRDA